MRRRKSGPTTWHVYARGARRLDLFREEEDRQEFLRLLDVFTRVTGTLVWAYALMSNHYHLILHGSSAQLTALMTRLNHQYAIYHNRKYQLTGHLLDGPYQAHPLRSPFLVLKKIAYVLLNPFKGGLETRPGDYPWTSLSCFRGLGGSPLRLDLGALWSTLGVAESEGRRRFESTLAREQARPARKRKDALTAAEIQEEEFEWLLEHAQEMRGALLGEDPVDVACHWGRLAGISPKAMARHLGHGKPGVVRSALYRFRKKLAQHPALEGSLPLP